MSDAAPVGRAASYRAALRVAVVPWALARVLVAGALLVTREVFDAVDVEAPLATRQGLLSWDAAFYADVAEGGYDAVPEPGLRFFPLVPLLGRLVGLLPLVDARGGVVVVASASALVAGVLLHVLVVHETNDRDLARRAVWLLALAPHAFVLVFGYAEATLLALALGTFVAVGARHWSGAALLGAAAGLCRPVGVLLVLPLLVEVLRAPAARTTREWARRAVCVVAPAVGAGAYLLWARGRTGDLLLPLSVHSEPGLRGSSSEPIGTLVDTARAVGDGRVGPLLHLATVALLVGLLVVLARFAPRSWTVYAGVSAAVVLTASNLDSIERYTLATFPFVVAAARLCDRPIVERAVVVTAAGGLVGLTVLALAGVLVP